MLEVPECASTSGGRLDGYYPWIYQHMNTTSFRTGCSSTTQCVPEGFPYGITRQKRFRCVPAGQSVPRFLLDETMRSMGGDRPCEFITVNYRVCRCDVMFGAGGADCVGLSWYGKLLVALFSFAMLIYTLLILRHSISLWRLTQYTPGHNSTATSIRKVLNLSCTIVSMIGFLLWESMLLLYTVAPEYSESIDLGHIPFTVGLLSGSGFLVFSNMLVSLHLIRSVPLTGKSKFAQLLAAVSKGKWFVRTVIGSFMFALLVAQGIEEDTNAISLTIVIYLIITLVTFMVGPVVLQKQVRKIPRGNGTSSSGQLSQMLQVVKILTNFCLQISLSLLLGIMFSVAAIYSTNNIVAQIGGRLSVVYSLVVVRKCLLYNPVGVKQASPTKSVGKAYEAESDVGSLMTGIDSADDTQVQLSEQQPTTQQVTIVSRVSPRRK